MKSRMFHIVTRTWNPVCGCLHNCKYCWARKFAEKLRKRGSRKYKHGFKPSFHPEEFYKIKYFTDRDVVFVCDMGDLFGEWVDTRWILDVLNAVRKSRATFLFLTKNPRRYHDFVGVMSDNCILGATIETNRDIMYFRYRISKAPLPSVRYKAMRDLGWDRKFISIEPILEFDLDRFVRWIDDINPEFVYIGYDNYGCRLPEPPIQKTKKLIEELREMGIVVYEKTIRKAWNE